MLSDKRKAVISISMISLGLTITWMGFFFHYKNMDVMKLAGPKNTFKDMLIAIAKTSLGKVELVALIIGWFTTLSGCIYLVVTLTKYRKSCGWIFFGIFLLLASNPILHVWSEAQQSPNVNGPGCIFILLSVFSLIFIMFGLHQLDGLKEAVVSKKIWITINILVGLGIFLGESFLPIGALAATQSFHFSAGLALLILSFVLVVAGFLVGIVAYAKSRHHAWELETIIERQKDIRKLKKLQRVTAADNNIV